jgi:hypothetical protein
MDLYHSQLMDAHMEAELAKIGADFENAFGRFGIESTGYSDRKLRDLALQLEALGVGGPRAATETTPDAGLCELASSSELPSVTTVADPSDTKSRIQHIHKRQQYHLLSNCTVAEQVSGRLTG